MSDLFAPTCPECGSDLPLEQHRVRLCRGCGRSYVNWFGNLIPDRIVRAVDQPAA